MNHILLNKEISQGCLGFAYALHGVYGLYHTLYSDKLPTCSHGSKSNPDPGLSISTLTKKIFYKWGCQEANHAPAVKKTSIQWLRVCRVLGHTLITVIGVGWMIEAGRRSAAMSAAQQEVLQERGQSLHERETTLAGILGFETLRTSALDQRDKVLIFQAAADDSLAGDALFNIEMFRHYDRKYDIAYHVIDKSTAMCDVIKKVAGQGQKIQGVVVQVHSDAYSSAFGHGLFGANRIVGGTRSIMGTVNNVIGWLTGARLPEDCFEGLENEAVIIYEGCSSGESDTGIASYIAAVANRSVVAPTVPIGTHLMSRALDNPLDVRFAHPENTEPQATRIFYPDGKVETPLLTAEHLGSSNSLLTNALSQNIPTIEPLRALIYYLVFRGMKKAAQKIDQWICKKSAS